MPSRRRQIRFATWPTAWGPAAAAVSPKGLCRFILPHAPRSHAQRAILREWPEAIPDEAALADLIERSRRYFAGRGADFSSVRCDLTGLSAFAGKVLRACRLVGYGATVTYGELAARLGRPRADRAVAGAVSRNPIPLVIPCHRVVGSGGALGGFSAPGGVALKQRMLELEGQVDGAPMPRRRRRRQAPG